MVRGGFCLPCNLKAEKLFIRDPNAYSFNNSNHLPQPQYENYLCNLCGNNSHDDYDCQQQFPLGYEQEPSYNQNCNDNYYPHDLPSFLYCDNCGESHATFQCQPMDQNIDFSGSDQIQTPQEECCIEFCEEQKQNMENTILELVEICRQKELYCMHDNEVKNVVEQPAERRNHIIESLQNFRVIHKSSISLNNTSQISPVHAIAPFLSTKEPEYSPGMGYEHPNTTSKAKSDEIIKSSVEELVPIPNECEVTSEDKREGDVLVCENSPICNDHSEILSDSNSDDDISSNDDAFEGIEYVEVSLPDPEIVSLEEENVEEEEVDLEDIFQIQDIVLREKLLSINLLIANIESLNNNPTPDCMLNSSVSIPIFEESDNSLSDNFSPEFETFCDHTEETRSGSTINHANNSLSEYDSFCFEIKPDQEKLTSAVMDDIYDDSSNDPLLEEVALFLAFDNSIPPGIENFAYDSEGDIRFLEELLIDDSILFPNNEASDFDNPSFPRHPPKPPDAEFDVETDAGEEISVVMNDNDELECLDPRDKIDVSTDNVDDDYFPFMFVI
nr:hypothetical protein [Tanacetum cinerariifolium]